MINSLKGANSQSVKILRINTDRSAGNIVPKAVDVHCLVPLLLTPLVHVKIYVSAAPTETIGSKH